MHIDMKNPKGIKLKTKSTYCAEDIDVVPTLEEVIVDPTDTEQIVEPSANYAGIKKVTVRAAGGSSTTYSVVEITSSQATLTDEQYTTLTASSLNKIKSNNIIYNLYQETTSELVYTANLFNRGNRITIIKNTKAITRGSLDSLTTISSYVKNSLDYAQSNTTYALSAYQGKVLNDRLTAVENDVATAVELSLPESSTQGTITDAQLTTLQASNENYILINGNEIYRLNDKGHTEGIWTYTHDGYNEGGVTKYLNLTIATKAFTITEQAGGSGSTTEIIELSTNDGGVTVNTSNYGRTYYTWTNVASATIDKILNNEVTVRIYDQTSGGGYYYCDLTGAAGQQRFFGEVQPLLDTTPSAVLGWTVKGRESTTVISFWRDEISLSGGGGSSSAKLYRHSLDIQCDPSTHFYFDMYATKSAAVTSITEYLNTFGSDDVRGSGYLYDGSNYRNVLWISYDTSNSCIIAHYDGGMGISTTYASNIVWADTVQEV